MKSNYDKYIKKVWKMKEASLKGFLASGNKVYADYLEDRVREIKKSYKLRSVNA